MMVGLISGGLGTIGIGQGLRLLLLLIAKPWVSRSQFYEQLLEFERMEYVSPPMRELILDVWSELAHKLPPEDAAPPDDCRCAGLAGARHIQPTFSKAVLWSMVQGAALHSA
jgi:hypothetical protein